MQYLSEITMALHHIRNPRKKHSVYHGSHCVWCKLLGKRLDIDTLSKPKIPYLHPEPGYLHASERSHECNRKWLIIDLNGSDSTYIDTMHSSYLQKYIYKYRFDHSVELSCRSTIPTSTTMERSIQWLLRDVCKMYLLSIMSRDIENDTIWQHIGSYSSHLDPSCPLWVFLDYGNTYIRSRPVGLEYIYEYSKSGSTFMTRKSLDFKVFQPTVLVWYLKSLDDVRLPCDSRFIWQRVVYELIINSPGHISVGDLLSSLRSILKPLGLTPILECNRVLDLNECFFGFKFLLPLNQSEFQEDPILEEECQQQQQTIYPRMQDE